jgi:hypothetical protein
MPVFAEPGIEPIALIHCLPNHSPMTTKNAGTGFFPVPIKTLNFALGNIRTFTANIPENDPEVLIAGINEPVYYWNLSGLHNPEQVQNDQDNYNYDQRMNPTSGFRESWADSSAESA